VRIDVEIWCNDCDEQMEASRTVLKGKDGSQSREYTCNHCDKKVGVALMVSPDDDGVHGSKMHRLRR
jgi:hypothetical protein